MLDHVLAATAGIVAVAILLGPVPAAGVVLGLYYLLD